MNIMLLGEKAMDNQILGQIVDLLMNISKKMDILIQSQNNLTNTIIKYDNEYQNQIASGGEG